MLPLSLCLTSVILTVRLYNVLKWPKVEIIRFSWGILLVEQFLLLTVRLIWTNVFSDWKNINAIWNSKYRTSTFNQELKCVGV